jgi:hypothetical protein
MSLAAFNAETASGEGAHGPDRSRLAKCYHCRTSRQGRQPAEIGVDPNTTVVSRLTALLQRVGCGTQTLNVKSDCSTWVLSGCA